MKIVKSHEKHAKKREFMYLQEQGFMVIDRSKEIKAFSLVAYCYFVTQTIEELHCFGNR